MLCPSIGPKLFWTIQIVLVGYKSFWSGPIRFGQVQIIFDRSKLLKLVKKNLTKMISARPKRIGPDENNQNHFGAIKGQGM